VADVKAVALQVVSALPDDADFSDLDEFLYERAMVERGRDDFRAGRTRSPGEAAPDIVSSLQPTVTWAEHATEAFVEALRTSHAASPEESRAFGAAVVSAVESLVAAPQAGRSLPEMGDPSILDVTIATHRISYRLIYDLQGRTVRVLWFTDNTTCYRNARPD
jgi:plasmid stabilization system protein ParE